MMGITKKAFGTAKDGRQATLYILENSKGMRAAVSDFGAVLVNLEVPDKNGHAVDVTLGFDDVSGYEKNPSYFGAVIGPMANRTGNASFTLDGKIYHLAANSDKNNLHSDAENGFHKRFWTAEEKEKENSVVFSIMSPAGDMGFPGNKLCRITYTLTEDNALELHYHGESDANCPMNLTNHAYFNLMGQGNGDIESHKLRILADSYTRADEESITTGEICPVAGTPMDFTESKVVGKEIREDFEQLNFAGGYDQNWVLNDYNGQIRLVARMEAPDGSRTMEVYTDLPGVQFYAGNFIAPQTGKGGAQYGKRSGMCLETQYFPDSANKPHFPSCIFGPEREYDTTTIYKFV